MPTSTPDQVLRPIPPVGLGGRDSGPVDGVAIMGFESREDMEEAWRDKASSSLRERITRDLRVTVVDTVANIV